MTCTVQDISGDATIAAEILALNNKSAIETSLLDAQKLAHMVAAARVATFIAPHAAFLLAFDQDADYDSPNFIWFRERFDTFLYVDRVIVGEAYRRLGLGQLLYQDLFRRAEQLAHRRIACEVNACPQNPVSDAFHAKLGFVEVGKGTIGYGTKSVRYLLRDV
jgi:predicted GNAT superfamily acetyltransferase